MTFSTKCPSPTYTSRISEHSMKAVAATTSRKNTNLW